MSESTSLWDQCAATVKQIRTPSPEEIVERMALEAREGKDLPEYALAASVSGPYLRRLYEIARAELPELADASTTLARMMDIAKRELLASKQDGEEC